VSKIVRNKIFLKSKVSVVKLLLIENDEHYSRLFSVPTMTAVIIVAPFKYNLQVKLPR